MAQGSVLVAGFEEAGSKRHFPAFGLRSPFYTGQDHRPGNGVTHFQDVLSHLT